MRWTISRLLAALLLASVSVVYGEWVDPSVLDACPGYNVTNVQTNGTQLTADLVLAGTPCDVFGTDIALLALQVTYETDSRIHLKITDPSTARYEVPESVVPRPNASAVSLENVAIKFEYTASPFSFNISRTSTSEVLFSTGSHPIIFEPQYLRLKTDLPVNANIYGLGEHTDPFRLPTYNTTRTLWSRDAYGTPRDTNLYGNHPIYFEHRTTGTHGVFLLNSDGMDIKINNTEAGDGTTLEYNVIGGVLDFYFLAGSETDPAEAARQYSEVVGTPAEVPYWSFGLHQCRYGYTDFVDVAHVIMNYSLAHIPLETMWTDIDYMHDRRIFTTDPQYFPLDRMREIVSYLHSHDQHYVLMTDPAVAYLPGSDYGPYDRGTELDIWLKAANGSYSLGIVWPGVTVFPDWFNNNTQSFWTDEFAQFYSAGTGIDIDGAWIDMNEPSNFCVYPCTNPFQQAVEQGLPPNRTTSPPDPGTPIFANYSYSRTGTGEHHKRLEDAGFDLLNPPYNIDNVAGVLSSLTANVNDVEANGLLMYNTHNIYGMMMSIATRNAMLARRPSLRTLVITRSTFAGAGAHVGHWLGDNLSEWYEYRFSISSILGMATVYQIPMVGADICGYGDNTTDTLCARWAMLGAFYPFMRNHNTEGTISQEFYRWPVVAEAARNALDIRYRFLDYIYTAFHQASVDGTPILQPLWFSYPKDENTFGIDNEYFFGPSLLVSPVLEENSTTRTLYLPEDIFYDVATLAPVVGRGANVTLSDVGYTEIPLHIRGGVVLPLRVSGAMTTTTLRETAFEFVVAPSVDGTATGTLYVDDGVSLVQNSTTEVSMIYSNGRLDVVGSFDYNTGVDIGSVVFLGVYAPPWAAEITVGGKSATIGGSQWVFNEETKVLNVTVPIPLTQNFSIQLF